MLEISCRDDKDRTPEERLKMKRWKVYTARERERIAAELARQAKAAYDREHRASFSEEQRSQHADSERERFARQSEEERERRRAEDARAHREKFQQRKEGPPLFQMADCSAFKFDEVFPEGPFTVGPFDVVCKNCGALHFQGEIKSNDGTFSDCCANGKIGVADMGLDARPYPAEIAKLMIDGNREFLDNIRFLNNNFATASLAVNQYAFKTAGSFCFKISGQVYRSMNLGAIADSGDMPRRAQIFMINTEEAMQVRKEGLWKKAGKKAVNDRHVELLEKVLREVNLLTKSYLMMNEEIKAQKDQEARTGQRAPDIQLLFSLLPGLDKNRYNMPRQNEIAAVFIPGPDGEVPPAYITVHEKGKGIRTVPTIDPNSEGMMYPLFHIYGNPGWSIYLKKLGGKRTKLTLRDHILYRMAYRKDDRGEWIFNPYHHGEELFQQFIVERFCAVEAERLNWVRNNQTHLKAADYRLVAEAMKRGAEKAGAEIGRKVILPESFTGGQA